MAIFTKPTSVPKWSDTGGNIVEPTDPQKDAGWAFQQIPPSSWENWKSKLNGEWWKWLSERISDLPNANTIAFNDPTGLSSDPLVELSAPVADSTSLMFRNGAQNCDISIEKTGQKLSFNVNGAEQFSSDVASFDVSSDVHANAGIAVGGGAADPGPGQGVFTAQVNVGVDAIPSPTFSQFAGGVKIGAPIDDPIAGTVAAESVEVGSSGFKLLRSPTESFIYFDGPGDKIHYDKTSNIMWFFIGGAAQAQISAGVIAAATFVPSWPLAVPQNSIFEVAKRNQCVLSTHVKSNALSGRSWNVGALVHVGAGTYRVTPNSSIGNDPVVIATSNHSPGLYYASAIYSNISNDITIRIRKTSDDVLTDGDFSLVLFGG